MVSGILGSMILKPVFNWEDEIVGAPTAAACTWGTFVVTLNGNTIWGSDEFEWTWVETLEWLNEVWTRVHNIVGIGLLGYPENLNEKLEDFEFAETHNMAHGVQGALVPEFVTWRSYDGGFVRTGGILYTFSLDEWKQFLIDLGDSIAARLEICDDERSVFAREWWANHMKELQK